MSVLGEQALRVRDVCLVGRCPSGGAVVEDSAAAQLEVLGAWPEEQVCRSGFLLLMDPCQARGVVEGVGRCVEV